MTLLVEIKDLKKNYQMGDVTFTALRGINLDIPTGDFVAIMGPSGSGKSTLLHLVGGLDQATSGSVEVAGQRLSAMNETELAKFRRAHIGFIFQFFNLIDNLTIQANIELPALLAEQRDKKTIRDLSQHLLEELGIATQAQKYPWELSGGQQQRVAIARALINQPTLLLADEPTGNLDSQSGEDVLSILDKFNEQQQTILMVTHDAFAASKAKRVLFIRDGHIVDQLPGGDAKQIAQHLADLR